MWRRLGPQFWVCVAWIVALGIAGLLAPWLPLQDPPVSDYTALAVGPSRSHWLGTDALGRDIFSRVVWGTRVSLAVGLFSVVHRAHASAACSGSLAGYFRRRTESRRS